MLFPHYSTKIVRSLNVENYLRMSSAKYIASLTYSAIALRLRIVNNVEDYVESDKYDCYVKQRVKLECKLKQKLD